MPIDTYSHPGVAQGRDGQGRSPTSDVVIDAIVAAVATAGGAPKRLTESAIAAHVADEEQRAKARAAFLVVAARARADQPRARFAVDGRSASLRNAGHPARGICRPVATHAGSHDGADRAGGAELLVDSRAIELDRRRSAARDRVGRPARRSDTADRCESGDAGVRARAPSARDESGGLAVAARGSGSLLVHDAGSRGAVRGVGRAASAGYGVASCHPEERKRRRTDAAEENQSPPRRTGVLRCLGFQDDADAA